MGTASSSAPLSSHAPGPSVQAAVLPLSITPDREAPRSTTRSTIRCPFDDCRLIQFVTSNRLCRKCHRPLDKPVVIDPPQTEKIKYARPRSRSRSRRSTSAVISTTDEFAAIAADAAKLSTLCPALTRFDQCLPVVLIWLRLQTGLSQRQIAVRTGVTRTAINAFECGHVMPSVQTVEKVAVAMSASMVKIARMCEYLRDGR